MNPERRRAKRLRRPMVRESLFLPPFKPCVPRCSYARTRARDPRMEALLVVSVRRACPLTPRKKGRTYTGGAPDEAFPVKKRSLPLSRVYGLLEPGPVVLITTLRRGRANVMTQSWHTMMEFEPPLVGCVVSDENHSFEALRATRECVINIPAADLARQTVGCGNTTGARVDKFARFGLTPVPASMVAPPLIAECFASLEARVVDTRLVNRYGFFVLEVVKAWIDPTAKEPRTLHHRGHGRFMVAGETIRLPSRMK